MREQFFKESIIRAVVCFFAGLIISLCSFVYIILHIYVDGYSLKLPIALVIIGLVILGWGIFKIKILGNIADMADTDLDDK